jgi:hypothetical protein
MMDKEAATSGRLGQVHVLDLRPGWSRSKRRRTGEEGARVVHTGQGRSGLMAVECTVEISRWEAGEFWPGGRGSRQPMRKEEEVKAHGA